MQIKISIASIFERLFIEIMHDQQVCTIITVRVRFSIHTFLLVPDTDLSTFTTGSAFYSELIELECQQGSLAQ